MIKEELEKEAVKRVDAFIDSFSQDVRSTLYERLNQEDVKDFLYSLYIDSAEPREKRIIELEQKLEQTEKDLAEYQFNYPTIKELEKGCEETQELLDKQIEATYKLDKKNAELEQQIEKIKTNLNDAIESASKWYVRDPVFSMLVDIYNDNFELKE